jgi:hypothetical protein
MAMAWLSHLMDRLRAAQGPRPGTQQRRILTIIARRDVFPDESGLLDALSAELAAVAEPEVIEERTVEVLAAHLRGPGGEGFERTGAPLPRQLDFWEMVAQRSGSPLARACRADLLLLSGDAAAAVAEFIEAIEGDPALVHFRPDLGELARERAGEAHLRYRMACLRAALAGFRPDGEPGDVDRRDDTDDGADDADDDYVRELYCELLEEHRGNPEALIRIRELGALIDQAVDRGELPRAIVRRAPRP